MPTGQLIYLQPPSSAAKVVGILVVIYGVLFGVLASIWNLLGNLQLGNSMLIVFDVVTIIIGVATVVGGVMLINYQRRGVMLLLLVIGLSAAIGVGLVHVGVRSDQLRDEFGVAPQAGEEQPRPRGAAGHACYLRRGGAPSAEAAEEAERLRESMSL